MLPLLAAAVRAPRCSVCPGAASDKQVNSLQKYALDRCKKAQHRLCANKPITFGLPRRGTLGTERPGVD